MVSRALASGQTHTQPIILNELIRFDIPGDYQLEVSLLAPIKGDDGNIIRVEGAGRLQLNIGTRDQNQLQSFCRSLVEKIAVAKSYDQAENAAKLLGAVNDPVAVPYLVQASGFWYLESVTLPALERIGDNSAVDALLIVLHSKDNDRKALARSSLMQIESRTTDTNLKEKIGRGLREQQQ